MNKDIVMVFSVFFMIGIFFLIPAYANHPTINVSVTPNSSTPGCDSTNECYIPYEITVDEGGEVIWSNDDTAAHTVTSGSAANGPNGLFDSSLFTAGSTFSVKFDGYEPGEYGYFCMVHPWMEGIIVVQSEHDETDEDSETGEHDEIGEHDETTTTIRGTSIDGSVNVDIKTTDPMVGEEMTIIVEFSSTSGEEQKHMNYDIIATQNGNEVLSEKEVHLMESNAKHTTSALNSDEPVDIVITLQGIGMKEPYTGPKGEVIQFKVVPEFGTIAMIVLGISITSIIVLSTKSKFIPRI